jgi:hypothetical protein
LVVCPSPNGITRGARRRKRGYPLELALGFVTLYFSGLEPAGIDWNFGI